MLQMEIEQQLNKPRNKYVKIMLDGQVNEKKVSSRQ